MALRPQDQRKVIPLLLAPNDNALHSRFHLSPLEAASGCGVAAGRVLQNNARGGGGGGGLGPGGTSGVRVRWGFGEDEVQKVKCIRVCVYACIAEESLTLNLWFPALFIGQVLGFGQ